MRTALAASIPFSGVRFILYALPLTVPGASYKDNPGWREPVRQKSRRRQTVCGILVVVATRPATIRSLAGFKSWGAFFSFGRAVAIGDFATNSTMVLFGLSQPHKYSGLR